MQIMGTGTGPSPAAQQSPSQTTLGDFQQFLKLFVSQLKYQDPLSPLGGDDFLAQTAQFSTVEQLVNLNTKAASSAAEAALYGRSTAAALIGRTVHASIEDLPVSGRVVQVTYARDGTIVLDLEGGHTVAFSDVVSVSEL